jgi:hypothetical protein
MGLLKGIFVLFIFILIWIFVRGSIEDGQNNSNTIKNHLYKGISINSEWDNRNVCQTARSVIKKNFNKSKSDALYSSVCTVSKVSAPLLGKFVYYEPYAVSWPNGVAARVFVTSTNGLKVMGISEGGIPPSWND